MRNGLYFSTYTNLNWLFVLENDDYKKIIIDSLEFLVINHRIKLYSFVIMSNHIHLIWLIKKEHILQNVQRDFLKFTGQQIKFKMQAENHPLYEEMIVNARDRKVQVWERNGRSFPLYNAETIKQKFNYIHLNPVRAKMCSQPAEYKFSSAAFYEDEISDFGMLSHISEVLR